jgi:hypothetical protein
MFLTTHRRVLATAGATALLVAVLSVGDNAYGSPARSSTPDATRLAPRLKAYSVVESPSDFIAHVDQQTVGTVACPSGTIAYGGGEDAAGGVGMNLNSSYPVQLTISPLVWGWEVKVNNATAAIQFFHVYAVCAHAPKTFTVSQAPVSNPASAVTFASADCPSGTFTLGGGAASSSTSVSVNMAASFPFGVLATKTDPGAWQVFENNASSSAASIDAYAICGKKLRGLKSVNGTPVTLPAGPSTARAIAQCPGMSKPTSGGVVVDSGGLGENMEATLPVGKQWQSYENNTQPASDTMRPSVLCAV